MNSLEASEENGESKRALCTLAGGMGGLLSAFVTHILAHIPEISWQIVHGWFKPVPWIEDSSPDLFRFALGIVLGVGIGAAEKRRPRLAFWMGAAMSFLICYLIVPNPFRFRE